eukprot:CAMPEP_0203709246 /NCGR_PEP_ID=MMETSP0091-20130426/61407_1 /ASSEMBLY_ACC=CAM_ASM_001089 /TAXON_ID=426623 /ORGANISM="Chaetoceros affinis, Strain CCMP159" /LENGTH=251 /DNA_ID=CAMNT_0050586205 /DNA_START=68 /DNA_END=823 /DNA_ORIENTATION=-
MTPRQAAEIWPSVVSIAKEYNLELVGPCGTIDQGREWYRKWLVECNDMYGKDCYYDYTCLHAYFYPMPCNGIKEWACLGSQAINAMNRINGWYNEFGKPTWVTEIGCNPWGGKPCSAEDHEEMMRQFIPYLDSSNAVFRYAWFSANGFFLGFQESNTNELVWKVTWNVSCPNRQFVGTVKGIDVQKCVRKSDQDKLCRFPLIISMDGDSCYCSKDACPNFETDLPGMKTWRQLGPRDSDMLTPLGKLYQEI